MWQLINDCGKQLNINYKLRQTLTDEGLYITEYKILEINIEDYVLQLISKSRNSVNEPVDPLETFVLNCEKIINYKFEVWVENEDLKLFFLDELKDGPKKSHQ